MKQIILLLLLCLSAPTTILCQSLQLTECQALARKNHPQLKQEGVIEELYQLHVKSINSSNLPQIDLTGRASYQSEVTKIDLNLPIQGIQLPEFSKDQYKLYIDIKEKIYDFGLAKNKKAVEAADKNINLQQNEVDLYKIKETVNSLFFNALALQQNNEILSLKKQSLDERIKVVNSAVKNGMSLPNELDALKAERIQTDQQQLELTINKQTTLSILGILTGTNIDQNTTLVEPITEETAVTTNNRPEKKLFELQKTKLDQSQLLVKNSHTPYLYAFAQAGYGRPGLNMFSNNFKDWYLGGIGLSWNLWDGNKTKHDRKTLEIQKKSIDIANENFERSINISLTQEKDNIKKLNVLLTTDKELVSIKETIVKRSASALDNGTITSADYIRDLNSALQAKAAQNIHNLQLIQAKINYNTILGN
jgi:outer membrane protein TolC